MTVLFTPIVADATITFTDADATELRRVVGVDASEDSVIQGILTKKINNSNYSNFLNRPIVQRVITQYYSDKSPSLYLWGKQIVAADGLPEVHIFQNSSWTLVDGTNYELIGSTSLTNRYLSINFTNQNFYDSFSLNADGVNPRVRVRYLTNTNSFADLRDDFKMYLMLDTRIRYDVLNNRQHRLDRRRISRMENQFKHRYNRWYPLS